jgi:hypothetical protein
LEKWSTCQKHQPAPFGFYAWVDFLEGSHSPSTLLTYLQKTD